MTQLSAQSILHLCENAGLIDPFIKDKRIVNGMSYGLSAASYDVRIAHDLTLMRHEPALANTMENFKIPLDVVGYVVDKSTYARRFITAFNTLLDPGWRGNLTLELVNLGNSPIDIKAGDPICQIVFHWLDEPTVLGYSGKYQNQPARPVPAIMEGRDA